MKDVLRRRLLEATLRLVSEQGPAFRMDMLAARLHISKRTVYEQFSSKQELIWEAVFFFDREMYEAHKQLAADSTLTTEEKILSFFRVSPQQEQLFSLRRIQDALMRAPLVREKLHELEARNWDLLEQLLHAAQREGSLRDVDCTLCMHMIKAAAAESLAYMENAAHRCSFFEYMTQCLQVLLYGMKADGRNGIHETNV